jgi:hypothetical protein
MAHISTPEPGSCQLDIPHASLEQIPSARALIKMFLLLLVKETHPTMYQLNPTG